MVAEQTTAPKAPTLGQRLARFVESPFLFICLAGATLALGVKLALLYAALSAPAIPGWNWSEHPNTLLIAYRASTCGCGAHLSGAISQAANHHAEVLVVASASDKADAGLAGITADPRTRLITGVGEKDLRRLSPLGRTAILSIQHGRISHQITGSVLPDDFFN